MTTGVGTHLFLDGHFIEIGSNWALLGGAAVFAGTTVAHAAYGLRVCRIDAEFTLKFTKKSNDDSGKRR
ncbi:hypothetical protein OHB26_38700 (plasmid) [Nocardia sp. NBC_01503]|uniref:hypothetical protein n=1 Tax=Nocardia sp. NBC_01503 TaxID=2975997 RepID=UPI002E7B94A3|nr:hypothetical protein [Nocardia sp. NBC_01503]WTL36608.1 hypothetical protein OHB26_38700 [Nocardia sp. NBC_01503]